MGWLDRDYSRSNYENRGLRQLLAQLFFGSVSLGTWFDVHVRIHASLIILIVSNLLLANTQYGMGVRNAVASTVILFGIVLLHEFGHCFAARRVGGDADEILLWPLGGLAFISTPRRPWPSFVGTAGGPLANVLICAITGVLRLVLSHFRFSLPWNPLLPFGGDVLARDLSFRVVSFDTVTYYLWWIYTTSYMLFFFNMLPIFPLDGGRILQTMLWPRFGYYRSMSFSCTTGMICAGIMGLLGIATGNLLLMLLALSGFLTCYQTRMTLRETSDEAWYDERFYSEGPSLPRMPSLKKARRRPGDDAFSWRDLNPLERIARERRKRQFRRLIEDDKD